MLPLTSMYHSAVEEDRHRGEDRRHAHHHALLATGLLRSSHIARLAAATSRIVRRDRHSLTNYACRLPDGRIGRTAVVLVGGDWTAVCRVA
jgi:hypothetical protein